MVCVETEKQYLLNNGTSGLVIQHKASGTHRISNFSFLIYINLLFITKNKNLTKNQINIEIINVITPVLTFESHFLNSPN